jgi:hypothetical protein
MKNNKKARGDATGEDVKKMGCSDKIPNKL